MRNLKKPDPRMPRYIPQRSGMRGPLFYAKFKRKFRRYRYYKPEDFARILDTFAEVFRDAVVENRDGAELPKRLGHIFVGTASRGTVVGRDIWNNDNKLPKVFYAKHPKKHNFIHNELWKFKQSIIFKSEVKYAYASDWQKYVEVGGEWKIKRRRDAYYKKLFAQKMGDLTLQSYNEFDLG